MDKLTLVLPGWVCTAVMCSHAAWALHNFREPWSPGLCLDSTQLAQQYVETLTQIDSKQVKSLIKPLL